MRAGLQTQKVIPYFYPRSPCGERQTFIILPKQLYNFYPRSPCGERLHYDNYNLHCVDISIHALLAESDLLSKDAKDGPVLISIHALLAESDSRLHYSDFSRLRFLSTLSLRRATRGKVYMRTVSLFLSTLSLRRATRAANCQQRNHQISIHALLAESDPLLMFWLFRLSRFLSTLSLRRATQCRRPRPRPRFISIHALLAESDSKPRALKSRRMVFLSTLSLRRATNLPSSPIDRKLYFYPRSPCGERPKVNFLIFDPSAYFYPRSPCGERPSGGGRTGSGSYFYPRSPYGERHDFRG